MNDILIILSWEIWILFSQFVYHNRAEVWICQQVWTENTEKNFLIIQIEIDNLSFVSFFKKSASHFQMMSLMQNLQRSFWNKLLQLFKDITADLRQSRQRH